MPQQLACPKCQMVVSVFEAFAAGQTLCPGCQVAMTPVAEGEDEPIVAEPIEMPRMVAVELNADAAPPRPTVVVPHTAPPKWKHSTVAQAWITVARGLDFQRLGAVVALFQAIGMLVVLLMKAETWVGFLLTCTAVGTTGVLFSAGRFCCYRVPPRTEARLFMGIACGGTAIATLLSLLTSPAAYVASDAQVTRVLAGGRLVAFGSWLAVELTFLFALCRIMQFVKRPTVAALTGIAAVALALTASLWIAADHGGTNVLLVVFETAFAGLCVLYLILLRAARNAVLNKTPAEKNASAE
jgi:hypothetical protein